MNESHQLETMRLLEEENLQVFCDSVFQKIEDEYVDLDEFETTFKELGRQLPLEPEWFETRQI